MTPLNCETCTHADECKKEHGFDFRVVLGTHLCLKSWENIKKEERSL